MQYTGYNLVNRKNCDNEILTKMYCFIKFDASQ